MDKQRSLSKIGKELMLKEPYYGFFLIMLNKLRVSSLSKIISLLFLIVP